MHLGTPCLHLPLPCVCLCACCAPPTLLLPCAVPFCHHPPPPGTPTQVSTTLRYRSAPSAYSPSAHRQLARPRWYQLHTTAQHRTDSHCFAQADNRPGRHPSLTRPSLYSRSIYIVPVPAHVSSAYAFLPILWPPNPCGPPTCPSHCWHCLQRCPTPCVMCRVSNKRQCTPQTQLAPIRSVLLHSPDQRTRLFPRPAQPPAPSNPLNSFVLLRSSSVHIHPLPSCLTRMSQRGIHGI